MSREDEIKQGLYEHTLVGHAKDVKALTEEGIALGMKPLDMLFGALIPSLQEVGRLFEIGDYFVPEMLVAAKAMQGALNLLRPLLVQSGAKPMGTVVMLTVKGDLHDIGKNLCNIMLEGAGFTVIDLGTNVSTEKVVAAVKEHQPPVLGFSAFLTTTMPMFKANMDALARDGLRDKVKIMVGGAPVTQEYADKMGADGYAADASATVRLAKQFLTAMGYDVTGGVEAAQETVAAVQAMEELMTKVGEAEASEAKQA
jgi:5-methyltetrahydrofolate--homocysteine methyltransferase